MSALEGPTAIALPPSARHQNRTVHLPQDGRPSAGPGAHDRGWAEGTMDTPGGELPPLLRHHSGIRGPRVRLGTTCGTRGPEDAHEEAAANGIATVDRQGRWRVDNGRRPRRQVPGGRHVPRVPAGPHTVMIAHT